MNQLEKIEQQRLPSR